MAQSNAYNKHSSTKNILRLLLPILLSIAAVSAVTTTSVDFAQSVRPIPAGFYGAVTQGITGNQARIDTNQDNILDAPSDYQAHRQKLLEAGVTQIRMDMDLTNTYNKDRTFNAWTSCNSCNINNHKSTVAWAAQNNITVRLVAGYMPFWLANNATNCASSHSRCEPYNYTLWTRGVTDYLNEVDCDLHPGTCVVEIWNEPYNSNFWLPDGTCNERIQAYQRMYNYTRAAVKAAYPNMIVSGPSGWLGDTCSVQYTKSFLGNYTTAQVDEFAIHEYSSGSTNALAGKVSATLTTIRNAGHTEPVCFTEWNVNNADINRNYPNKHILYLTDTLIETLNNHNNVNCLILFEWTATSRYNANMGYPYPENYILYSEPALDNEIRASFNVSRDFSRAHPPGSTIVRSSSTVSTIKIIASKTATEKSISITNDASTAQAVTATLSASNAASVQNTLTGQNIPVVNGVVTFGVLDAFSTNHYRIIEQTPTNNTQPPVVDSELFTLRVNAGGPQYVDAQGNTWVSDAAYVVSPSGTYSTTTAITGTASDPLYQIERYSVNATTGLQYTFTVPSGVYNVTSLYAEIYPGSFATGARVFDETIEGRTTDQSLDVYARAGANTALSHSSIVIVTDGTLNIRFSHRVENPKINALVIEQLDAGYPIDTIENTMNTTPAPPAPTNTTTPTNTTNNTVTPPTNATQPTNNTVTPPPTNNTTPTNTTVEPVTNTTNTTVTPPPTKPKKTPSRGGGGGKALYGTTITQPTPSISNTSNNTNTTNETNNSMQPPIIYLRAQSSVVESSAYEPIVEGLYLLATPTPKTEPVQPPQLAAEQGRAYSFASLVALTLIGITATGFALERKRLVRRTKLPALYA